MGKKVVPSLPVRVSTKGKFDPWATGTLNANNFVDKAKETFPMTGVNDYARSRLSKSYKKGSTTK